MRRVLSAVLFLASAAPLTANAQFGQPTGFALDDPVLRRIWTIESDSSQLPRLAQALFDSLGPRLTASPGMNAAQNWLIATYTGWGISARKEQYGTWRGWRRGKTHIDLVAPRARTLEGMMLAWSPPTPKGRAVRAPAVLLPDVADSTALVAWLPQARGKFVLISFAQPTCRSDDSWEKWATPATFDSLKARRTAAQQVWQQRLQRTGYHSGGTGVSATAGLTRRLEAAGVAGIITSNWSQGWGVQKIFGAYTDRVPVVDIACEDYGVVFRLAQNNQGPILELTAESQALGEVPVFNVVAELKGSAQPTEYVMLSAHFDSWDGGSGATDNGTGTLTMLEAMRLLKLAYPNPRRTILVGHWSGEEQGLNGSRGFVKDHPEIVNGLQALFNQDNGTGRVENMSASGFPDAGASLARYLARVPADITRNIKFSFPGSPSGGGTDHAAFVSCGGPGFNLGSGDWDYGRYTWHTNRDTYDKISFDDVENNAALAAMLVYLASEDTVRMSREKRTVFAPTASGQAGAWPECRDAQRATPPLAPAAPAPPAPPPPRATTPP
ncbi:MAG TPA: M20/M25/M40 family metallo-hydrolase [Gemmatimonadales bacterium]|nr:M20/M25/M40 family metallo-hydrolase [Gemmatimonadales bacterium]